MKEFQISIDIAAPPERVWSVMEDVEHWHEWTPSVTSITKKEAGPLTVGSRMIIRQPKLPPAMWRVTELEPGKNLTSITGSPLLRVAAHHSIEPADTGSRVTLSIEFSGILTPLVARITNDLNHRYLVMEANGLKERCESMSEKCEPDS